MRAGEVDSTLRLWSNAQAAYGGNRLEPKIIVNALGMLDDPNLVLTRPPSENPVDTRQIDIDARALSDARAAGLTAINITLGYVGGPEEPFEYSLASIAQWDEVLTQHRDRLIPVYAAADILRAAREKKIGVIYGFQNGAMVGDDPERVDVFARRGVRVFQLTYNPANQLGDGAMTPENRGLTRLGHAVIQRLNAARLMVDLSHSGQNTCLDAVRASSAPVSINHTGCRALCDTPRNKTDEELHLVAEGGGFIGIYFMPFLKADSRPNAEDVIRHIEHAVNVCGEDHVGIGTDGSAAAVDDMDAYREFTREHVAARARAGVGATGETPDTVPFIIDLRGPGQFARLAQLLKERGFSEARIDKILGLNFIRFAQDVWGS